MNGIRTTHHALRFTRHVLCFRFHATLIALPLLLLAPIVFGGRVLYWGVPLMQFYPWQHFAVETWRMGEVPLWNPLVGNGAPLAASLQTGAFYPLNFLYLLLPTEFAMGYTAALHLVLAGLFMFAFLRSIGLRSFPALIGAMAFQLSGFLIARLSFFSITATLPWVAAWLWRAERAMQSGRWRDGVWLAIVVGLGLLAGHAQTALYGMFLLAAYAMYRFVTVRAFPKSGQINHQDTKSLSEKAVTVTTKSPRHQASPSFLGVSLWLGVLVVSFKTVSKTPRVIPTFLGALVNRLARPRREASDRAWRLALRQLSRGRWLRWSIVGFGVAFGVGLAAIQLLPAAELTRESQRVGGLDYTFAMTHSYWPWRLLTLLTPDLFGNPAYGNFWGYDNYWENAAYIGVLPLGLVLVAIRQWWRWGRMKDEGGGMKDEARSVQHVEHYGPRSEAERGFTPFFLVVALVSVILAFGWFTQIYPFLFRTIPGFSLFQGPARWLSAFTIALCVLAAIGAESMLHGRGELRRSVKWIVVGSALIVAGVVSRATLAGLAATLSQKGMFPHETFPDATLRLGMLVAIGGLLLGLRPSSDDRRFRWWASAFAAVVAIDLLTAHAALNPAIDPAVYRLPTQSARAAQAEGDGRMFMFDADDDSVRKQFGIRLPFSDFGPADVDRWMQFRETLIANTSMIDGYPSASNFDPLLIGHYLELRDAVNDLPMDAALRLLRLMHVGYVSSPRSLPLPIVARTPAATLYRIENTPPRAWIVPSARIEENALAILLDPAFDPLSEVVISPSGPGVVSIPNASRLTLHDLRFTISSLHDTPNTVTIRAASQADGYLILADTWYPGWRARVDGQPVAVLRANVAFRAVAFPAGEHTIEFRYEPDSVRLGAWISGVSAVVLAAGLVFTARPRR